MWSELVSLGHSEQDCFLELLAADLEPSSPQPEPQSLTPQQVGEVLPPAPLEFASVCGLAVDNTV